MPKTPSTPAYFRPLRILVIEDDEELMGILTRALRKIFPACSIDRPHSAEDALRIIQERYASREERFDLVVSDIMLPGQISGIELWETCEARFPGMPYLLISGMGESEFKKAVSKDPVQPPFLAKPFSLQAFRHAVEDVLERGKSRGWVV